MTPIRYYLRPLEEGEPHTGILHFTNGIPTHEVIYYSEWSHRSHCVYDKPDTPWFKIPSEDKPDIIYDKNGIDIT